MSSSSEVNHLSQPCIYGLPASSNTERKSRFLKWLSKVFKGSSGSTRGSSAGGRHPQLLEDENMVWRVPHTSPDDHPRAEKDREELDHDRALSLAEDLKRPDGYRRQTDNDEPRGLQGSLHRPSYPPYMPSYPAYPPFDPVPFYPRGYRLCGGCNREIGYGKYLGCMGTFFHPECFCCRSCGYPITEHEGGMHTTNPVSRS